MPILGLGTAHLHGNTAKNAVLWALDAGYRLFDTATIYDNEEQVGDAIKSSEIPREEVFITTKVWNTDQGYESTLKAFDTSLKKLKTSYIDLYLIHWPIPGLRDKTWKALEKIHEGGRARAIGVSNYTIRHLNEVIEKSDNIPTINQVEFSPFLYQQKLLNYCKTQEIVLEAYSPLTRGRKLHNVILKSIAQKYNKTIAQIMIRWGLQHEIVEIPKSGKEHHIQENAEVYDFEIIKEDMIKLNGLNEDFRIGDDPHSID
jgi:diketogulonate reductase-like aldo/keto reductase